MEKFKSLDNRKKAGIISSIAGIIILLLHVLLNYPLCGNICTYCIWTWYLVGGGMLLGGIYIYFVEAKPRPITNNNNH